MNIPAAMTQRPAQGPSPDDRTAPSQSLVCTGLMVPCPGKAQLRDGAARVEPKLQVARGVWAL